MSQKGANPAMALIGNVNTFGLEYTIVDFEDNVLIGSAWYWVNNSQVGNYRKEASINDLISCLVECLRYAGKRHHEEFFKMDAKDFFYTVDETLYGMGNPQFEKRANEEQWARFSIIPQHVNFDNWKIYLVDLGEMSRILVKGKNGIIIQDFYLPIGVVDKVLYDSYIELLSIEQENQKK
jgi:hypothetical protein